MEKRSHYFNSKLKKKINNKNSNKKIRDNIHQIPNLINVISKDNFQDNSIINKSDIRKTISHTTTSRRFEPNFHINKEKKIISKEKHKNNYFNTLSKINECNRSTFSYLTKINNIPNKKPKQNFSKENINKYRQKQISPFKEIYENTTSILGSFYNTKYVDISLCDETKCLISTGLNLKRKKTNLSCTNNSFYFHKKNIKTAQEKKSFNIFGSQNKNKKINKIKNPIKFKRNTQEKEKIDNRKSPKVHLKQNKLIEINQDTNYSKKEKNIINKKEKDNYICEKLKEKLNNINFVKKLQETSYSHKKQNKIKNNGLYHIELNSLPKNNLEKKNSIQKGRHNASSKPTNFSSFFTSEKNISNKPQFENIEDKSKNNIIDEKLYNLFESNNYDRGGETETQEFESKFLNYDLLESSKNNVIVSNLQIDEHLLNNNDNNFSKLIKKNLDIQYSYSRDISEYEKPVEEMEVIANEILNNSNILNKKLIDINNNKIKSNNNKIIPYDTEELKEGEIIQKIISINLTDKKS